MPAYQNPIGHLLRPCVHPKGNGKFSLDSIPFFGAEMKKTFECEENGNRQVCPICVLFKFFRRNYRWLSPLILGFVAILGLLNLWGFIKFIGREDVFFPSLAGDKWHYFVMKMVLLAGSYFFVYFVLVFWFLVSSSVFVFAVREFKKDRKRVRVLIILLYLVVIFDMAAWVFLGVGLNKGVENDLLPQLEMDFLLVVSVFHFLTIVFIVLNCKISHNGSGKVLWRGVFFGWWGFSGCVAIVVFVNVFVCYFYLNVFSGDGASNEWGGIVWLVFSISPLAPVVVFYCMDGKGLAAQIKGGLSGLFFFHVVLLVSVSGFLCVTSEASMKHVGISDQELRRYRIDGKWCHENVQDKKRWGFKQHDDNSCLVNAISFYKFGAVSLLCPADLADLLKPMQKQSDELERGAESKSAYEIRRQRAQECLIFLRDEVSPQS